ncbi:MAG: ribosome silencing factor [Bdellovibrionales bacterium]|nr:ribosome silencing factor [Bdellovibrionales bacterium]
MRKTKQITADFPSVAQTAANRKAFDIKVLDLRGACSYADYFVITSATSVTHAKAIADAVYGTHYNQYSSMEGYDHGQWIIIDHGDVVTHIFLEETRTFYNLEKLWSHVPSVEWDAGADEKALHFSPPQHSQAL